MRIHDFPPKTSYRQDIVSLGVTVAAVCILLQRLYHEVVRPISHSPVPFIALQREEAASDIADRETVGYAFFLRETLTAVSLAMVVYQLYQRTRYIRDTVPPTIMCPSRDAVPPTITCPSLPPEIIGELVRHADSRELALTLSQCNRAGFAARFTNPHMELHFKTLEQVNQFLCYCQQLEQAEAQGIRTVRKLETLRQMTTLTLDLSDEQKLRMDAFLPVFACLPNLTTLDINLGLLRGRSLDELKPLADAVPGLKHLRVSGPACLWGATDSLQHLPVELCRLKQLETLILRDILQLWYLPEEMGELTALKVLYLNNLSVLKLPRSLGKMDNLEVIECAGLRELDHLPDEIGRLPNLKHLALSSMRYLGELPDMAGLVKLRSLTLENLRPVKPWRLPDNAEAFAALKALQLINMPHVSLPSSFYGAPLEEIWLFRTTIDIPEALKGQVKIRYLK